MRGRVLVLAAMLVAVPLTRPASAKKLNEFQKKELQEARQGRKDEKAELQKEQADEQDDQYERARVRGGQRHRADDYDNDVDFRDD